MNRSALLLAALAFPQIAGAADVLLCHADPGFIADVHANVVNTGLFTTVADFDCMAGTPNAGVLASYDAVLVWSNNSFANPTTLGDRLADYVDAGGGVVQAVFSNGSVALTGRFDTGAYEPITGSSQSQGAQLFILIDDPFHPILAGVGSFNGGMSSYHTGNAALEVGAVQQARWTNGLPLVATLETHVGRTVGLNFFPPSSTASADFWDVNTDGDLLLANALLWAANVPVLIDSDGDGWTDDLDTCDFVFDLFNTDSDFDGIGDVCEPDSDGDGIDDDFDNCDFVFNVNQNDSDGDGIGNLCEPDSDGDGVVDDDDFCDFGFDPANLDSDGDGFGDVCEPDSDFDGVIDDLDNCDFVFNVNQNDTDGDGIGNLCEPDSDFDGVIDDTDTCDFVFDPANLDSDGDGFGDVCEPDTDTDGVIDDVDTCDLVADASNLDSDGDGVGDVCEGDLDGDGVVDDADLCPENADPSNADSDGDGVGDACEPDGDGDGVIDDDDLCPDDADPTNADSDGDGIGDACDTAGAVDTDGDGVSDDDEADAGTDPSNPDSDGDGSLDGADPSPLDAGGDADGQPATPGKPTRYGLGCDTSPGGGWAWLVGLLGVRAARRRR